MAGQETTSPPAARTRVDHVTGQLRLAIMKGSLSAGERLVEKRLAFDFEVSRSTVREALQRLAASGLVEVVPHRGHRVRGFSDRDADQICELFAVLEAQAARKLRPPVDRAVADQLRRLAGEMAALDLPDDLDRFIELDRAFHGVLVDMADQPWLAVAWRSQESLLGPLMVSLVRRGATDGPTQANRHLELAAAAESGDANQLVRACLRHYYQDHRLAE